MSPRSFARHFRAATGTTPHRWLLEQRLQRAELLLETTDLTVDVVAQRSGFGSADTLRHHFARRRRTTPVPTVRLPRLSGEVSPDTAGPRGRRWVPCGPRSLSTRRIRSGCSALFKVQAGVAVACARSRRWRHHEWEVA
jgi:AraC-like DNA-binding protein